MEGLWRACRQFDPSLGLAFSTYAVPLIKGQILRQFRDFRQMHVPRWLVSLQSYFKNHPEYENPTDKEISDIVTETGYSRFRVITALRYKVSSLDEVDEDGNPIWVAKAISTEDALFREKTRESILELLALKYKGYRLGLLTEWVDSNYFAERPFTQTELGNKYGCSQVQASRIIRDAIQYLKENRNLI